MWRHIVLSAFLLLTIGCSSVNTYPTRVRAGETVAIGAGWKHHFSRNNINVTITPVGGSAIPVDPGQVRASINLYPDPLSSLVVAPRAGVDISQYSLSYGFLAINAGTGGDPDLWETVVFLDIPDTTPVGLADILITNPEGESETVRVDVFDVGGISESFDGDLLPVLPQHLQALERIDHYEIAFDGATLPYAIQLDLTYSADVTGEIINTKGGIKNVVWSDDGAGTYRVLITPARHTSVLPYNNMSDLKFYVAIASGTDGVANVSVVPSSVAAFDADGQPVIGVTASATLVRGAAGLH